MEEPLQAAVAEVEEQEDEHLKWAGETLTKMCLQMVNEQRAPDPERWQTVMTGPVPPIEMFHPSPFTEGLLDGSRFPHWVETPITRSVAASNR